MCEMVITICQTHFANNDQKSCSFAWKIVVVEHGRRVWWHLGTYLMAHLLDASDMDCIRDVDLKENLSPVLCIYECSKVLFNDDFILGHHQSKLYNTTTWFANVANYKSDKSLKYVNITYFNLCLACCLQLYFLLSKALVKS